MKKIILRKDYKTRVVPVEESIGHYLAKEQPVHGPKILLMKTLRKL